MSAAATLGSGGDARQQHTDQSTHETRHMRVDVAERLQRRERVGDGDGARRRRVGAARHGGAHVPVVRRHVSNQTHKYVADTVRHGVEAASDVVDDVLLV